MASIENLQARLKKEMKKRDKAAANVKKLQAEITRIEMQEVLITLNELNISPAEAKALLKKAKSTIVQAAQPEGDAPEEGKRADDD